MKIFPFLLASIVLLPVSMAVLLLYFYPYHPVSITGWCIFSLLSLPVLLAGELFGNRVLAASSVSKLPQLIKIAYGVIVIGSVMFSLMFGIHLLDGHLAKWGS